MMIRSIALTVVLLTPAGAQAQTFPDCIAAFDANDTRIGRAISDSDDSVVFVEVGGVAFSLNIRPSGFEEGVTLFYSSATCDSTPLLNATDFGGGVFAGSGYYLDGMAAAPAAVQAFRTNGGSCQSTSGTIDAAPAQQFSVPAFAPPFHLEPEECIQPITVASFTPVSLLAMCVLLGFGAIILRKRTS
jgi:hypothetical protein